MNCPNCNKKVSLEWAICPYCKCEPAKCPNCDSGWLPQDAKFCPACGCALEGDGIFKEDDDLPQEISKPFPIAIHGYTIDAFLKEVESSFGLKGNQVKFSILNKDMETLIYNLEIEFGITIPETESKEWKSIDDILISLEQHSFGNNT